MGVAADREHHFTHEDADEVLESVYSELKPLLSESISKALEASLDEFLTTTPLISLDALKRGGIPQVLLRIGTVQTLLDTMKEQSGFSYAENLKNAGRIVGLTFGVNMIGLLERKKRIPIAYD